MDQQVHSPLRLGIPLQVTHGKARRGCLLSDPFASSVNIIRSISCSGKFLNTIKSQASNIWRLVICAPSTLKARQF